MAFIRAYRTVLRRSEKARMRSRHGERRFHTPNGGQPETGETGEGDQNSKRPLKSTCNFGIRVFAVCIEST